MAEPIDFPESNAVLMGEHISIEGEKVLNMPVMEGESFKLSCWQLNEEELEEVKKTGKVFVYVWGAIHPPISVGSDPFKSREGGRN